MSCLDCHDFMDGYNRGKREGVIEELEKITVSVDFEEKRLLNVCAKEYRVNANDIKIAMDGIRNTILKLKGENDGNDI